jgi:hypothetical protein
MLRRRLIGTAFGVAIVCAANILVQLTLGSLRFEELPSLIGLAVFVWLGAALFFFIKRR